MPELLWSPLPVSAAFEGGGVVALTRQQRDILESDASVVFVSAAAGSGKTTLLVQRYLRAVLDAAIPMDRVPTVTFTRKAAAEMRSRIRKGLIDRGRPDLAWGIDEAPIGTIHSLCSRILRAHVVQAGVDPTFQVLDEEHARILSFEAMERAWESVVAQAGESELDLLVRHGRMLQSDIPSVCAGLRQAGMSQPRLDPPDPGDLERDRAALGGVLQHVSEALAGMPLSGRAASNLDGVMSCREWLPRAQATWDGIEACAAFIPHMGCAADVKPVFALFKDALLEFRAGLGRHYLVGVHVLADQLLRLYHGAFQEAKLARGALDFADLEIEALALLRGGERPFGPGAWLMVDEFQDTNALQCSILDGLGAGGTLTVGDPFQSIYSFRGAEVAVFGERLSAVERRADRGSHAASLTTNFRSSPGLLRVVNHIFGHDLWFGPGFSALEAPGGGGRSPDPVVAVPAVEVMIVDPDVQPGDEDLSLPSSSVTRFELEAAAVAERVAGLLREGWRKRDIAILLRAFTHVSEFESALVAQGVETYVVQGRGFFASEELSDVTSLLSILVNPHDDPALVAVLRSPLMGLPDDGAFLLRTEADDSGSRFLWEVVRDRRFDSLPSEYVSHLVSLDSRLGALRARLGAPGLSCLIEDAVEAFDYDLVILRTRHGRRRLANLRKLMRHADEFEEVEGPNLAAFLDYLRRRGEVGGDRESSAPTLSEEEDVVRIMTVHKAKGLEFPVVIVPGMGAARRTVDTLGLRASREGVSLRVTLKSGDALALGPHERMKQAADELAADEEKRLYYVACTRAESRLVLVGLGAAGCRPADGSPIGRVVAALGVSDLDSTRPAERVPHLRLPVSVAGVRVVPRDLVREACAPPVSTPCEAPRFPTLGGGRSGVRRVSFSSLEHYERCPRSYYLERILGFDPEVFAGIGPSERRLRPFSGDTGGAAARVLGTVVHRVLEELDLRHRPGREVVLRLVGDAARREAIALDVEQTHRAAALVSAFWESGLVPASGSSVVRKERPFLFRHEGLVISGYIDLIVESEAEWTVVDYKTTRLAARGPEEAAAHYELQGALYALACLLAGARQVRVAFLFLEAPKEPVVHVYRVGDLPRLKRALSARLRNIASGDFPRRRGECGGCDLAALCDALPE